MFQISDKVDKAEGAEKRSQGGPPDPRHRPHQSLHVRGRRLRPVGGLCLAFPPCSTSRALCPWPCLPRLWACWPLTARGARHQSPQNPGQPSHHGRCWTLRMGNGGQDCCRARLVELLCILTRLHTCARDGQATVWGDPSREVRAASQQWLDPRHLGGPNECPMAPPPFCAGVKAPLGKSAGGWREP